MKNKIYLYNKLQDSYRYDIDLYIYLAIFYRCHTIYNNNLITLKRGNN